MPAEKSCHTSPRYLSPCVYGDDAVGGRRRGEPNTTDARLRYAHGSMRSRRLSGVARGHLYALSPLPPPHSGFSDGLPRTFSTRRGRSVGRRESCHAVAHATFAQFVLSTSEERFSRSPSGQRAIARLLKCTRRRRSRWGQRKQNRGRVSGRDSRSVQCHNYAFSLFSGATRINMALKRTSSTATWIATTRTLRT